MMTELSYVKAHLRIESTLEDELLTSYVEAAEETVQKYVNMAWDDMYDEYGDIPHSIKNAVCMLVGSMYRDREATSTVNVNTNPVVVALLKPYKKHLKYAR